MVGHLLARQPAARRLGEIIGAQRARQRREPFRDRCAFEMARAGDGAPLARVGEPDAAAGARGALKTRAEARLGVPRPRSEHAARGVFPLGERGGADADIGVERGALVGQVRGIVRVAGTRRGARRRGGLSGERRAALRGRTGGDLGLIEGVAPQLGAGARVGRAQGDPLGVGQTGSAIGVGGAQSGDGERARGVARQLGAGGDPRRLRLIAPDGGWERRR